MFFSQYYQHAFGIKEKYYFAGWSTDVDGQVEYTDGQSVSFPESMAGETIKLYAIWSENPVTTYYYTYTDKQEITNLDVEDDGSITLKAVWQATYTVRFNVTGGATGEMDDQVFVIGECQLLRPCGYTHNGSSSQQLFKGWSRTSGGTEVYSDQEKVCDLSTIPCAVVNLYTVWGNLSNGQHKITFNAKEGIGTMLPQIFDKTRRFN